MDLLKIQEIFGAVIGLTPYKSDFRIDGYTNINNLF